ncbi:MAG: hypothetical protein J3K34DRAFT_502558 [Monoraphidium minutum]|nr:MAG: hypothetical protein J3K34DRAFT_502558 [Monoraphidium minutum]
MSGPMAQSTLVLAAAALLLVLAAAPAHAGFGDFFCDADKPCECTCSCAFGVYFGESLCGYANTTMDVADMQAIMSGANPDFADALDLYNNGRHSFRVDSNGTNTAGKRTMRGVATSPYTGEDYSELAKAQHGGLSYLDRFFGAAVRGDGDYAGKCCGVRAEASIAGARWFSMIYSIHEINAGMCYAQAEATNSIKCGKTAIGWDNAASEALHAMALVTGADSLAQPDTAPFGTSSPANLWQVTQALNKCKKPGVYAPSNNNFLKSLTALVSEIKDKKSTGGMEAVYKDVELAFATRFLQYSMASAVKAAAPKKKDVAASGTCRQSCYADSYLASARIYWKAAEPIVNRYAATEVAPVNAVLDAAPSRKTASTLKKSYARILDTMGAGKKLLKNACPKPRN